MSISHDTDTTPAERRRQKVRTSILAAAERVFAKEGEDGLSIRRLAEEIDYSPAAIYKYFGSKDELVDQLKEDFFTKLMNDSQEVRDSEAPFRERARRCISRYIEVALEKPRHYAAAFSGICEDHGEDVAGTKKAEAFDFLISMVEEGQRLGHFDRDQDAVVLAKSVWACCHGAASLMTHMPSFPSGPPRPSNLDRAAFIEVHTHTVLQGLYQR